MVNPGDATDGMLNSFQIDVSERNSTEPFAQPWEMSIHPWGSSVCDFPQCACVSVCIVLCRYNTFSCSLIYTHTHIVTPYPQITLQLLSSVPKNISNYCFKCSSITKCQVSSISCSLSHSHTHTVSVCICEEGWMKLRWSIAKHRDWIESMLQCSGFL